MNKREKVVVSVLAIIFSLASAGIGFWLVGAADFAFPIRFVCNFVFMMQFPATVWVVAAVFRKNK